MKLFQTLCGAYLTVCVFGSNSDNYGLWNIFNPFPGVKETFNDFNNYYQIFSKVISVLSPVNNISHMCEKHLKLTADNLIPLLPDLLIDKFESADHWAFKLVDSFGKPQSGTHQLNLQWLGHFHGCMEIGSDYSKLDNHPVLMNALGMRDYKSLEAPSAYRGQYCLVDIVSKWPQKYKEIPLRVGTCFPSSCSTQDQVNIINHFDYFNKPFLLPVRSNIDCVTLFMNLPNTHQTIFLLDLSIISMEVKINKDFCQTKDNPMTMDALTIITICILFVILLATIVTTMTHLYLCKDGLNVQRIETPNGLKLFMQSFSLKQHVRQILADSDGDSVDSLAAFNVLTTAWIFTYNIFLSLDYKDVPYANKIDYILANEDILYQPVFTATFGYHILFQINSLLISYDLLKHFQVLGIVGMVPVLSRNLVKRIPTYLIVTLFMMGPLSHLGTGPLWPRQIALSEQCRQRWWKLISFTFNFDSAQDKCNSTYWYISVDIQMILVISMLTYIIYKQVLGPQFWKGNGNPCKSKCEKEKPICGLLVIGLFWVTSMVILPICVSFYNIIVVPYVWRVLQKEANVPNFDYIFKQPWGHVVPIVSGALLAYIFHRHSRLLDTLLRKVWINVTGWCISVIIIMGLIYGTYPLISNKVPLTTAHNVTYECLATPLWSVATAWLILNAKTHTERLRWFFKSKLTNVLVRTLYCTYLVHFLVISYHFNSTKIILYFSGYNNIILYVFVTIVSFTFGLALTLSVEMPATNLVEEMLVKLNLTYERQYKILCSSKSENGLGEDDFDKFRCTDK